jgi:hypothetical protein
LPRSKSPVRWVSLAVVVLIAATGLVYIGQRGCRPENPLEAIEREIAREQEVAELSEPDRQRDRPKPDFELAAPTPLPAAALDSSGAVRGFVKPGHWTVVSQRMKANYFDFEGVLTHRPIDSAGRLLPLPGVSAGVVASRPVALATGASKQVETTWLALPRLDRYAIRSELRDRSAGSAVRGGTHQARFEPLLPHQYYLVVLARQPRRYAFLDTLYSVNAPIDSRYSLPGLELAAAKWQYRVVAPPVDDPAVGVAAPDNPLCWTAVAYIVWDQVDPQTLSLAQQEALIDWLHWGGQLIVSGPDSLDLLGGSFLAPYLSAAGSGARRITPEELAPVAQQWSTSAVPKPPPMASPWSGVRLAPQGDATWLPGLEGLASERRIGKGRVVVTGFQLAERDLLNWADGFENLVNCGLLRRPGRRFAADPYDEQAVAVLDAATGEVRLSPGANSRVRLFVRDARLQGGEATLDFEAADDPEGVEGFRILKAPSQVLGVAGWDDSSPAAERARIALREAAGVRTPGRGFVLTALVGYLLLVGPFNWALFHSIGRVEWAWIAAPVLAIASALAVVRQAQLDIGFVRAQTEVAVLETQPGGTRGHLARFTALYTSLATRYDMEFASSTAVAAPFPAGAPTRQVRSVTFERQDRSRLAGLDVDSATTEFVRSEEMLPMDATVTLGSSSLGRPQLENRTPWELSDVAVVRRETGGDPPRLTGCWIGKLSPSTSAPVTFASLAGEKSRALFWQERADAQRLAAAGGANSDRLDLEGLLELALAPATFEPGETRMVARLDAPLPGVTVRPRASQIRGATLWVGRLSYPALPVPDRDANSPYQVGARPVAADLP